MGESISDFDLYRQLILCLVFPWLLLKFLKVEAIYNSLPWNHELKITLEFILKFQCGLQTMLVLYLGALLLVSIFDMSVLGAFFTVWGVLHILIKIREAPRKNYP